MLSKSLTVLTEEKLTNPTRKEDTRLFVLSLARSRICFLKVNLYACLDAE
jgi:hypothetical protein